MKYDLVKDEMLLFILWVYSYPTITLLFRGIQEFNPGNKWHRHYTLCRVILMIRMNIILIFVCYVKRAKVQTFH